MSNQPNHEKPAHPADAAAQPAMEKRGVIGGSTPYLADQDDLDAVEKSAGAALVAPGRSA